MGRPAINRKIVPIPILSSESDPAYNNESSESDTSVIELNSSSETSLSEENVSNISELAPETQSEMESDSEALGAENGAGTLPETHSNPDDENESSETDSSVIICPVCYLNIKNRFPGFLPCGHMVCKGCLIGIFNSGIRGITKKCPVCRKEIDRSDIKQIFPM